MAEQTILVCDVCGEPARGTVGIRAGGKGYAKDLCARHLGELLHGTRAPRRGQPRKRAASEPAPPAARSGRTSRRSPTAASAARG